MENTQKLMDLSTKMAEWSQKWITLYGCSDNKKFQERIDKIEKRLDKELNE